MKIVSAMLMCALSMVACPRASAGDKALATFAGRFYGSVSDATCASRDMLLTLQADGSYAVQSHCQDDLQASPMQEGTWSQTWNGTCVQLVPAARTSATLEFAIHDDDLLVLTTGSCIEPVEDPRGRTLRRADTVGER